MKILTAQQMREMDRLTVERCGIPYPTLMETAGSRVVEAIIEHCEPVTESFFSVFCGKGNNGGDGAVIARLLWMRGAAQVRIYLFGELADTKGEARINFEIVKRLSEEERTRTHLPPRFTFQEITKDQDADIYDGADVVIDALFGTGLTRLVEGQLAVAIQAINDYKNDGIAKIISVDIPSGLPSDSGQPIGPHVRAHLTVSFTAPKLGNVLSPAAEANGKLLIASIGTPDWLLKEVSGSEIELVEEHQVKEWLATSRRTSHAHKNSVGDVLLIAGSRGKTGAAALSSETVLRAGAGLVTVATAKSAQPLLITQTCREVMTEALDETESGAISEQAVEQALRLAEKKTVVAIGPGLSSAEAGTRAFVRQLVERRTVPMVVDADGLNALAPWPEELKGSEELPIIITPHPGEMARLTGKTNADVQADRIGTAREFAVKHQVITVLKGSRSLIAAPDGTVYVNPTGNAGMATAGSGDVLTGLISGLLAQRPEDAVKTTIAGVYLHGLAGDLAAAKLGMRSLIASDIIAHLSEAILQVGGEAEKGTPTVIRQI